ncbi:MAG: hypothetical protein E5Y52_11710, partial [Mesorhizobium sp.]|uniref:hypothetical protein n=1 Tax=Mesorhizobium sp. TaxID=1871066 RepID=UPI001206DA9A
MKLAFRRDESLVGFGADIDSDFGQSLAKWPKTTKCRARLKAGSRRLTPEAGSDDFETFDCLRQIRRAQKRQRLRA